MDEYEDSSREMARREFLKLAIGVIAGVGATVLVIPLIGSLVGPSLQQTKRHFTHVVDLNALPTGQPVDVNYPDQMTEAYMHETVTRSLWVIKHSSSEVTVYSPICPHLGCRYNWEPQTQHFVCPCHGSVFALDGKVLAGPAPRSLDTLPTKIENDQLSVEWERFKLGIPQKVVV